MTQALTEAKLRHWMQRLGPKLIALSAGICRDRHGAEEIVQEAFVKLWQRPPDAGEVAYSSWLRRVVTNLSINALQRTRRPAALPERSHDRALQAGPPPERDLHVAEDLETVQAAMDELDPPKRAILMLRAAEGLSYEEIAEHLDVPIGTVMSRLNRARTALLEILRSREESGGTGGARVFPFEKYRHA